MTKLEALDRSRFWMACGSLDLPAILAVVEAAEVRAALPHNDTCSFELTDGGLECDCGKAVLAEALTALGKE